MHAGASLRPEKKAGKAAISWLCFAALANVSPESRSLMSGKIRGISLICRKHFTASMIWLLNPKTIAP